MKHELTYVNPDKCEGECRICGVVAGIFEIPKRTKKEPNRKVWMCPNWNRRTPSKPKEKKRKPKSIGKKCDDQWSLLVRERDGYKCALDGFEKACGGVMQAHHLIGRTEECTRWVPENGVCLCYSHHIHGVHGTRATEMNHELLRRLPAGRMDELNEIRKRHKKSRMKVDKDAILESLTAELQSMEAAA